MNRPLRTTALACVIAVGTVAATSVGRADTMPAPAAQPAAQQLSDAQILGALKGINDDEITAANMALDEKKVTGDVEDFAKMMKSDHTDNNVATQKLADKLNIKPEVPDAVKQMAKQDGEALVQARSLDTPAFSKKYVDMMVAGHTAALNLIDQAMATTQNADIKDHLKSTRDAVAKHLDHAKKVQADLNKM